MGYSSSLMQIYRLTRKKYSDKLSGKGAAIKGARWNSIGTEMIYCAENRSLAMAEVAVDYSLAMLPDDYVMLTIQCDDTLKVKEIPLDELPAKWNVFPPLKGTQEIGDHFIREGKFALCRIPSVVTPGDYNLLVNPHHKGFEKIKIVKVEPFVFDNRLFAPEQ